MKSLFLFLFLPFLSLAQLPTQSVIRENGVVKIDVWHHELPSIVNPFISGDSSTISPDAKLDTVISHSRTMYFDALGRLIKNVLHYEGKEYIGEFSYDKNDRLNDRIFYIEGTENFRETVTLKSDSMYEFKRWTEGKLVDHYLTYPDSTIHISYPLKDGQLPNYIFDRDSNYTQIAEYRKGKLLSLRKESWVRNINGHVSFLEVDFQQFKRATKRNGRKKSYHETFPVTREGEIVAKQNTQKPRQYFTGNERKSALITTYDLQEFKEDELLERSEDMIILTFDRDNQHYFFSYDYFFESLQE